jgi:hypothetical protein
MSSQYNECIRLLKEVLERLESIEGELDLIKEEIGELRSQGRSKAIISHESSQGGRGLIKAISDNLFLDTRDVMAKRLLKRLIDNGKVVLLRDESANREVVTTKEVIRNLLADLLPALWGRGWFPRPAFIGFSGWVHGFAPGQHRGAFL